MKRALFALACSLACCAGADAQSMFRGDAAHSGSYAGNGPREFHRVRWTFPTGGRIVSSAVTDGATIYFGSSDGYLYAVDARSGQRKWQGATGGPIASTPAVAGGVVYAGSYDGKFYAFDAQNGKSKWKFATAGERHFEAKGLNGLLPKTQTVLDQYDLYQSSPAVADGTVFFGSGDGNVYALDAADGALRWKFTTGDVVHASPAVVDGVVFVGSWDSRFYAIDAATGAEKWRFQAGEDPLLHNQVGFASSPTVADGVVYTGCRDSNLYALDAATGGEKWRANNAGSWVVSTPAVKDGRVYYLTSDSSLYHVVDARDGKQLVKQEGKAWVFSSPSLVGDVVLYGVTNGTLVARDRNSGDVLWEFRTDASKQNLGWVLTAEGRFNNSLLFRGSWVEPIMRASDRMFSVGSVFSSPLFADGAIYFGSTDGSLYAIE
jgi:outer membrane protein assembly factor BamB